MLGRAIRYRLKCLDYDTFQLGVSGRAKGNIIRARHFAPGSGDKKI